MNQDSAGRDHPSAPENRGGGLLREPLLHFVVLGGLIFALEAVVAAPDGPGPGERAPLVVSTELAEGLAARHEDRLGSPPDASERRSLVEAFVRREVLYRSAMELGLDQSDDVVRQRLIQKMEFVLDNRADVAEPTDEELIAFMESNADRYRDPPRMSFTHVFFARDQRRQNAEGDAETALAELRAESPVPERAAERGDPFMLQYDFVRRSSDDIRRGFGSTFADAVEALPLGEWSGPVLSSYGVHLVRVGARSEGGLPPLDVVRERVAAEWADQARTEAIEAASRELVESYPVEYEEGVFE